MRNLNGLVVHENVMQQSDIPDRNILICNSPVSSSTLTSLKDLNFSWHLGQAHTLYTSSSTEAKLIL